MQTTSFTHPDVLAVCEPIADDESIAREPCVVVEVTSPSTARVDRGEKLDAYRKVASLRAYLIVDHRRRRVERHWRASSDEWQREEVVAEGSILVSGVDVELTLDDIYHRVELPAVGEPDGIEYGGGRS